MQNIYIYIYTNEKIQQRVVYTQVPDIILQMITNFQMRYSNVFRDDKVHSSFKERWELKKWDNDNYSNNQKLPYSKRYSKCFISINSYNNIASDLFPPYRGPNSVIQQLINGSHHLNQVVQL